MTLPSPHGCFGASVKKWDIPCIWKQLAKHQFPCHSSMCKQIFLTLIIYFASCSLYIFKEDHHRADDCKLIYCKLIKLALIGITSALGLFTACIMFLLLNFPLTGANHNLHCESGGSYLVPAQQHMPVWEQNPQDTQPPC